MRGAREGRGRGAATRERAQVPGRARNARRTRYALQMLLELATATLLAALGWTPRTQEDADPPADAAAQEGAPERDERPPAVSEVPS